MALKGLGLDLKDKDLLSDLQRIHQDLIEPAKVFEEQKIGKTIVFFGSSQIMPMDESEPKDKGLVDASIYYHAAEQLAYKFSLWQKEIKSKKDQYVICSGGGPGIMEATNKGATRAGARSIGLTIDIPEEQARNRYITPDLRFDFSHFFVRKFWFFYYLKAVIAFPGGMGTFDEVFEILNMMKTKKLSPDIPVVLFGSDFWKSTIDFEPMVRYGTIDREDLEHIHYADSVEETYQFVKDRLMP